MLISAIQKLTLLDYPGKTACTVFLPGCNFRCGACHNPEFVIPEKIKGIQHDFIPDYVFFRFLQTRKGKLDGVCITGGEPTVHRELEAFIKQIKAAGFLVKLDTNGSNPNTVYRLLKQNLLDYVAMDVKAGTKQSYRAFTGGFTDFNKICETIELLKNSEIDYEFRTTLVEQFHSAAEFSKILELIDSAKSYYLQNFENKNGCLNRHWENCDGFPKAQLEEYREKALKHVERCEIRV
jgi:pyruvate formate lyase activating enzyme